MIEKLYNLNIPEIIRKEDAAIAHYFSGCKTVTYNKSIDKWTGDDGTHVFDTEIPSDWLEEIHDEPVTAEYSFYEKWEERSLWENKKGVSGKLPYLEGFKAGEANEWLRYRPLIDAVLSTIEVYTIYTDMTQLQNRMEQLDKAIQNLLPPLELAE